MRPPIYRRLTQEDFQDAPSWLSRLLLPLNQFMEQTVNVFSRNVSLGDNILARTFTISVTTDANYLTGTFETIRFSWDGANLPTIVTVSQISRDDGTVHLGATGTPAWNYNGGIVIRYVSGLAPSTKYNITFTVF